MYIGVRRLADGLVINKYCFRLHFILDFIQTPIARTEAIERLFFFFFFWVCFRGQEDSATHTVSSIIAPVVLDDQLIDSASNK